MLQHGRDADPALGSAVMSHAPAALSRRFAVLDPALRLHGAEVGPGLYPELDRRFDGFRGHVLIAEHVFTVDWSSWECHPAGDELVLLLEGEATLCLRIKGGDQEQALRPGEYAVVPAGTWHTARVAAPTRMLFVTPGEGTLNQEMPP